MKILFVATSLMFPFLLFSQHSQNQWKDMPSPAGIAGKISGTVHDSHGGFPLEFATVSLFRKDSLVTGAVTNKKGFFLIDNLKSGKYKIDVSFIGYEKFVKDSILIIPKNPEINLGNIKLNPNIKLLKEAQVTAEKDLVQLSIDKKVYDVTKDLVSQGGAATDVLNNVPSVSVDIDGNVTLQGSGNVKILIDGKPSGITGDTKAAVLKNLPASSIESVEVITNPSVKYDPEGMSGIINIVLKKNRKEGFNGNLSASAGTGDKYNGSATMNHRMKKVNFFTTLSARFENREREGKGYRKAIFSDTAFYINQYSGGLTKSNSQTGKAGMDWFINSSNTLSLSGNGELSRSDEDESIEYNNFDDDSLLTRIYKRNNIRQENGMNADISLDYKKTFPAPKEELTANIFFSQRQNSDENQYTRQDYYTDYTLYDDSVQLQRINNARDVRMLTAQSDFVYPAEDGGGKYEMGIKGSYRSIDNELLAGNYDLPLKEWENDSLLSNRFNFEEKIIAWYAMFSSSAGKFDYQAGIRAENAMTRSEIINTGDITDNDYSSLFPSVHLGYKLNGGQELQLNYSRRVNRPEVNALNGWTNYSDPMNIRKGNPKLMPEYINSFGGGYTKYWEKQTLIASGYFKQTVNLMQRVRSITQDGASTITFMNLNNAITYGIDITLRNQFMKGWTATTNFNFFQTIINAKNVEADLTNEGWGWFVKMTSNITIRKNIYLQISGNYDSPKPFAQGTINAQYAADAGIRKELFKGKGAISINMQDIFNTRRFSMRSRDANFTQYMMHKRQTQVLMFTLTYRFGQGEMQQPKKQKQEMERKEMQMEDY